MWKIILASNSPRRRDLMSGLGLPFKVKALSGIDECFPAGLREGDIPQYISRFKAEAYRSSLRPDELLITADTIVWVDGQVLGKPADEEDARRMLRMLSGKTHQVYTGVTLTTSVKQVAFQCRSDVTFATLEQSEIDYYITHFHPMDKAGAYGVQEWIGYVGVTQLTGSYFNVMGLPIQRLYNMLKKEFNITL